MTHDSDWRYFRSTQSQLSFYHDRDLITIGIIVLNLLVFVYEWTLSGQGLDQFVTAWGAIPAEILTGRDLSPTVPAPVYANLVSSMFIHGGFLHLFGNMLFLCIFGDNIERAFGRFTFLIFYFIAGITAGLFNAIMMADSTTPGIGASGAIAGVLAAYLLLFPSAKVRGLLLFGPFLTVGRVASLIMIGFWFVIQLGQGIASLGAPAQSGGVACFAHVGRFIAGIVLTLAIRGVRRQSLGNFSGGIWIGRTFRHWAVAVVI